jgi:hypothetical protein
MVLLGDVGQAEACFGLFGNSVNLNAREVHGLRRMYHGLEIILGTLDATPRLRGSSGSTFRSVWR